MALSHLVLVVSPNTVLFTTVCLFYGQESYCLALRVSLIFSVLVLASCGLVLSKAILALSFFLSGLF